MKIDRDTLHWAVEVSARAQRAASLEQDAEFDKLLAAHRDSFRCIGCGMKPEFHQWGEDTTDGYHNGGGLMIDRFGYGSSGHDMARVAVFVCDACVDLKGVSSSWLDKLDKHWNVEKQHEPNLDFQI